MDRDQLKGKQTSGEWIVKKESLDKIFYAGPVMIDNDDVDEVEAEANGALVAEAGTVANRIGLWPEDMVKRAGAFLFQSGDKVINIQAHGWGEGIVEFVADHETVSVLWNKTRHSLHTPDQLSIVTNYPE